MSQKLPKFRIGQAVTLAEPSTFEVAHGEETPDKPRFGEVYHVTDVKYYEPLNIVVIALDGLGSTVYFSEDGFAPVMPNEALAELLAETIESVTV